MDILQTILNAQQGGATQQLSNRFGLTPDQTTAAVSALMPALAAGLKQNMASEGGLSSLISALSTGGHQRYLENPATLSAPETVNDGNGILGHLFGSKDVSRQVAQRASAQTGIDTGILKQMLPLVAALAMGGLSRQSQATGGLNKPGAAGGLMSMLTPMLDRGGDGGIADDLLGMAGRFLRK